MSALAILIMKATAMLTTEELARDKRWSGEAKSHVIPAWGQHSGELVWAPNPGTFLPPTPGPGIPELHLGCPNDPCDRAQGQVEISLIKVLLQ